MEVAAWVELLVPGFLVYVVVLCFHRIYFDALSHIPGPKLAAATLWYEFYYDVTLKGRYTWKIKDLHHEYGPIIRISPHEIHIDDPDFIDTIYPGASPRTRKYGWGMRMFGVRTASLATESHELHRIRRSALAPYFSRASVQKLESGIQSQVDKLVSRLQDLKGSGRNVNLFYVYACLTADVICQYAFARSYGFLDDPDFSPQWHHTIMDISMVGHLQKQFGFLMPLMKSMPKWLVKLMQPGMATLFSLQERCRNQVIEVKGQIAAGEKAQGQTTIFHDVLMDPGVRVQEKDTDHLQDEAQTVIGAGTSTTGHILALTSFHIIANPHIRSRLGTELSQAMDQTGGRPTWVQLEQLPYLNAVVTEGLRIGYGVAHRLQRLFPDTIIQYNGYAIPAMTPVSMSSLLIHDNPSLFPDPRKFDPERFIEHPHLRKYLVPFSRGSKQCLGMNLAYAELYHTLAAVFAPGGLDLKLWETDSSDAEIVHDFVNTSPRLDSKGIRVIVE